MPVTHSQTSNTLLIQNGLLVDGTGGKPVERASILVENGRISRIAKEKMQALPHSTVIDATGKTILPGLIDMHAHLLSGGFDTISEKSITYDATNEQKVLKQMLYWGVTAVYNPVQPLEVGLQRRTQAAEQLFPSPRLFISGPGFTASGGWAGTFEPTARVEPKDAKEVEQKLALLEDAKVDIVKVFYEDMSCAFVTPLPKLAQPLLEAIIREAHRRNMKVMAHVYDNEGHKDAMRAGADIMAHSAVTASVDNEYIELAKKNNTLYLATLSIYHDTFDEKAIRGFIAQDFVQQTVPKKTLDTLAENGPLDDFERTIHQTYIQKQLPTIRDNLRRVFEAGVAIGVGPDTGVMGAFPGLSVHREMELMVQSGIAPAYVLVAATKTAARYLGQEHLGTIEKGKIADLVIVKGNPLDDIRNTRRIDTVIKDGGIVNREALLEDILAA